MRAKHLSTALMGMLVSVVCLLMVANSAAQETATPEPTFTRTPDPRSTIWTPPPPRYTLQTVAAQRLPGITFDTNGIGSIAVDSDGLLYIGDGFQTVLVYSEELAEVRRFNVQQPSDLAFAPNGQLIIGQRNQATLRAYNKFGEYLGTLWQAQDTTLEAFAIAPDGEIAVVASQVSPRTVVGITRLKPNGEVISNVVFGSPLSENDAIHGVVYSPNGDLNLTVSGYGFIQPVLAAYVTLNKDGKIQRGAPLPVLRDLVTPAVPTRLASGDLIIFSAQYLTWWSKDNVRLAQIDANIFRIGFSAQQTKRRAAIAAHPDSRSMYIAEIYNDGALAVARVELVDRLSGN